MAEVKKALKTYNSVMLNLQKLNDKRESLNTKIVRERRNLEEKIEALEKEKEKVMKTIDSVIIDEIRAAKVVRATYLEQVRLLQRNNPSLTNEMIQSTWWGEDSIKVIEKYWVSNTSNNTESGNPE